MTVLGFGLAVVGVLWLAGGFVVFPGTEGWGFDFRAYADAADRLRSTGTLYLAETIGGPYQPGPYGIYYYAPPLAVAITPLTSLGSSGGITGWYLVHIAALVLACALMPVRAPVKLLTFGAAALSFGVTRDLVLGNVSIILLLLMSMAWRWLDRPMGSVAQALAMAIRPTLGILLIWQALRRQWRPVFWTLTTGLVLIVVSMPLVGFRGYSEFIAVLRNLSDVSGVQFNHDLGSTALSFGASAEVATLALLAGYAIAIGAILLSLRRDREVGFMVAVSGSLLLSPILWDHYLTMLVLPAAFLAQHGRPWALLLPLAAWLPASVESLEMLYPVIVLIAALLPFLARVASPDDDNGARARPASASSLAC